MSDVMTSMMESGPSKVTCLRACWSQSPATNREASRLLRGATAVELWRPRHHERRRGSVDDGPQLLLGPNNDV